MARYFSYLLFLCAAAFGVRAQNFDINAVEVEVNMNPARYRTLLDRFERADTTLSAGELALVYFGYAFTPEYVPFESFANVQTAYEEADYMRAEQLAADALKLNPVSLELSVIALASADHLRGEGGFGRKILDYGTRCDFIATAILSSGSGTSAASPFHVIAWSDVSRILRNVLGVERVVDRTKVGPVDAVKVVFPGSDRQHIIYFDNTRENLSKPRP
jgi:putative uncharacterized protein (fragment)